MQSTLRGAKKKTAGKTTTRTQLGEGIVDTAGGGGGGARAGLSDGGQTTGIYDDPTKSRIA